jgi:hypothetical protein
MADSNNQIVEWPGRFTQRLGLLGWLSSKLRRSPLYGSGDLEVHRDHLMLLGWQRNWLGRGVKCALNVPLQQVSNAIVTERGVRFEIRRTGGIASRVEFQPNNATHRQAIQRALPQADQRNG